MRRAKARPASEGQLAWPAKLSCGLLSTIYFLPVRSGEWPSLSRHYRSIKKAITFAGAVCTITRGLPRGYFFLGDQLSRASLSIAANIAEGNGRFTKADLRNFFGIARGSVQECVPLLELAARQGLLKPDAHSGRKGKLEEIAQMLSGLINGLDPRDA